MIPCIPIRDLKNTASISELVHAAGGPVTVTKNGYADMVMISADLFERMRLYSVYEMMMEAEAKSAKEKAADADAFPQFMYPGDALRAKSEGEAMNPWLLYHRLIVEADADDTVSEVHIGQSRTVVTTRKGFAGAAMTLSDGVHGLSDVPDLIGKPLREVAERIKSWNFTEASVAAAAINACLNRRDRFPEQVEPDAFLHFRNRVKGQKVAVIGHFQYLEERLRECCELYVLERSPRKGDLPDPACEYILPSMDTVFITGSALANKTLPRLLELSQSAFTILTGPSVPMSYSLFDAGVDALCGFCVQDAEKAAAVGCGMEFFRSGEMVCVEKNG